MDMQEACIRRAFAAGALTGTFVFGSMCWLAVEVYSHKMRLCEIYQKANEYQSDRPALPIKTEEWQSQYSLK